MYRGKLVGETLDQWRERLDLLDEWERRIRREDRRWRLWVGLSGALVGALLWLLDWGVTW